MDKIEDNIIDTVADATSEEPTKTLDLEQVDGGEAALESSVKHLRDQDEVTNAIIAHVNKTLDNGATTDDMTTIQTAVNALYERHTATGEVPTVETLVADLGAADAALGDAVAKIKDNPFAEPKRKRTKIVVGAVAAAVVVVLIGAGVAVALNQPTEAAPAIKTPSQTAPVSTASEKSDAQSEVKVTIIAEGAGDTATKAKVSVADADGKTVVKETEVVANAETSLGDLAKGDYVLTVSVAPVLEDGSTYTLPAEPTKFNVDGHGKVVKVESALSKHAKEDMSAEELEAAAAELEAVGNTAAAANVADAAQNAAPSQGNTGSTGGSNAPSNNGGSSGGNSGGNSGGSTPAHQHNWVAQTSQQWVPNVVWVVDSAAWSEPVYVQNERCICNGCGTDITGITTSHFKEAGRGSVCNSWHSEYVKTQVDTIYHEATGHNEDQGYYETVTTGQVCSGCGAVQ